MKQKKIEHEKRLRVIQALVKLMPNSFPCSLEDLEEIWDIKLQDGI